MTNSVNILVAEGLGDVFENLGEKGLNISEKLAIDVLKNPGRALDTTAKTAIAAASRNPKSDLLTLPEMITFYH